MIGVSSKILLLEFLTACDNKGNFHWVKCFILNVFAKTSTSSLRVYLHFQFFSRHSKCLVMWQSSTGPLRARTFPTIVAYILGTQIDILDIHHFFRPILPNQNFFYPPIYSAYVPNQRPVCRTEGTLIASLPLAYVPNQRPLCGNNGALMNTTFFGPCAQPKTSVQNRRCHNGHHFLRPMCRTEEAKTETTSFGLYAKPKGLDIRHFRTHWEKGTVCREEGRRKAAFERMSWEEMLNQPKSVKKTAQFMKPLRIIDQLKFVILD